MLKKTKTADTTEEIVATQEATLTHTALGVFQDESTGHWALAEVKYNPVTKQTGELKVVSNEEGSREAINIRFKIAAVKEGLVT